MLTIAVSFIAIWLSYIMYWVLQLAAAVIITPMFGLVCGRISFFGLTLRKENGKWKKIKSKFSFVCQYDRSVDNKRPIPADIDIRSALVDLMLWLVQVGVTVLVYFVLISLPVSGFIPGTVRWRHVAEDVFIVNLLYCIIFACSLLYVHILSRKSLRGYCMWLQKRLRNGQPWDDTMMLPLSRLPYKHYDSEAKRTYYTLYAIYLLWVGRYNDMREPIYDMAHSLRFAPYKINHTGSYYQLIFYYSRIEQDRSLAMHFMDKMRAVLAEDPDANAKRIIAYYAYCIEGDRAKARFFIDQAKSVVDVFSIPGIERELERRLINELDEVLRGEGY